MLSACKEAASPQNVNRHEFTSTKESLDRNAGKMRLHQDWKFVQQKYKLVRLIGKGSYGTVLQAVHIESGRQVAIKHLKSIFKS